MDGDTQVGEATTQGLMPIVNAEKANLTLSRPSSSLRPSSSGEPTPEITMEEASLLLAPAGVSKALPPELLTRVSPDEGLHSEGKDLMISSSTSASSLSEEFHQPPLEIVEPGYDANCAKTSNDSTDLGISCPSGSPRSIDDLTRSLTALPKPTSATNANSGSRATSLMRSRPISRSAYSLSSKKVSSNLTSKNLWRSLSADSMLERPREMPFLRLPRFLLKESGNFQGRTSPLNDDISTENGSEEMDSLSLTGIDDDNESNCEMATKERGTTGPFRTRSLHHSREEEDPNAELPLMSTILERMPWNPMRARDYLYHYLELAQLSSDEYKVQKLKQQLKYLTIRNKKRSYRNIAHHNDPECEAQLVHPPPLPSPPPNLIATWTPRPIGPESWWRNGMRSNMHCPPLPPPPMPPPPPPPQTQWDRGPMPRRAIVWPTFRVPLFRPEGGLCRGRPMPVPPMGWPAPHWSNINGGWNRPQPPAWPPSPCRQGFSPPWNGYRAGLRPMFPMAAGGDIVGSRQLDYYFFQLGIAFLVSLAMLLILLLARYLLQRSPAQEGRKSMPKTDESSIRRRSTLQSLMTKKSSAILNPIDEKS